MKNILKYTLIFSFLLGILSGCEDDLLDQANPNAITSDSFWKSKDDYDKAVTALYSSLQFPAVSGANLAYQMLRGDMAGTESWYGAYLKYTNLTWNDGSEFVKDRWSQLYIGIFRANQILYYIDGADFFSDDEKNIIIAQAKFVRGLNYFWLAHTYNGAVIRKTMAVSDEDMHLPFSSRTDVITEIVIPDLEFAYNNLPKVWEGKNTIGRYTWGAAAAMLGKTYLYEKDWSNAAKYFKEVIDSDIYRLVPNYMDNFTLEGEFNAESILEVAFSDNYKEGVNGSRVDDVLGTPGAEATTLASSFASIVGAGGYNTVLPTYWLQELFVAGDSIDINNPINAGKRYSSRTFASIVVEFGDGDYYQAPLTATADQKAKTNFSYGQGSKVKKWTNWYWKDAEDSSTGARTGINFRHIRYADVLLMYAEAILEENGDVSEALKYIDMVRQRAGVITLQQYMDNNGGKIPLLDKSRFANQIDEFELTTFNKASLLHHIQMVERPLELSFEGHRWFDLVRWGMVREIFDARKTDEDNIKNILLGNYIGKADGSADEKIFPLYLNQRVRPDWPIPATNYSSDLHDYFPIPSVEVQSNKQL